MYAEEKGLAQIIQLLRKAEAKKAEEAKRRAEIQKQLEAQQQEQKRIEAEIRHNDGA